MTVHSLKHCGFFPSATLLMMLVMTAVTSADPAEPPSQTLCILDFDRLGDDASVDWLQEGLADMMISTMNRLSPYWVIERRHLKHLLLEHGLATSGVVDMDTAVRQARLVKAQLVLQGSFTRQGDRLTIRVRLIRISDQKILKQATWTHPYTQVLPAPRALSKQLLASPGNPVDPGQSEGIEKEIPTTIDVAKAYYKGIQAFDGGRYSEALAQYLDAARHAGGFIKVYPAVLEMYYLLGKSEHAVLFARQLAQSYEDRGDVPSALEYYFEAAQQCLNPLNNQEPAIDLFEKILFLVKQHERKTGEIQETKRFILDKIDELHGTGKYESFGKILADQSIRYRVWSGDIEAELIRRTDVQARGGDAVFQDNKWIRRPVPKPSALMWKIRAQLTLGRTYARVGRIEPALYHYRKLLEEYEFLTRHHRFDGSNRDAIRTEAHFMWLHHYGRTGQLVRDHGLNEINRLNVVRDRLVFTRDFGNRSPDPRGRVVSRYKDRGHEYFDFAAPSGHQIDSVILRAKIEGIAEFGLHLPNPVGWPPQFSFSKRFEDFKFSKRGTDERTVALPPRTEFLSIGTSWGPGLFSNTPAEVVHHQRFGPKSGPDIARWEVSFAVSPKEGVTAYKKATVEKPPAAVQELIDRGAAGWENAVLVREDRALAYTGNPSLDVYAEDWLVYSMDDDIQILHRRDPRLKIDLPSRSTAGNESLILRWCEPTMGAMRSFGRAECCFQLGRPLLPVIFLLISSWHLTNL